MFTRLISIAYLVLIVSPAWCDLTIDIRMEAAATTGLTRFVFNLSSTTGLIEGVEAYDFGDGVNPFINQIHPFGGFLQTPYVDTNNAIVADGGDPLDDSHFLFHKTNEGLLDIGVVDSTTALTGAISSFAPFSNRDVAQVVIPTAQIGNVPFLLKVVVSGLEMSDIGGVIEEQTIVVVPEPSAFLLVGILCLVCCIGAISPFVRTATVTTPGQSAQLKC